MNLHTFHNESDWIKASIEFFEKTVNESNHAEIALSGGSTPIPVYEAIANTAHVKHTSIEVYQVDERYVPADHPESNQRLIMEHLIQPSLQRADTTGTHSPYCCFVNMRTDISIEKSVKKYESLVRDVMKAWGGFTLTILGIGPDGHTASLFPHITVLHETKRLVAHTTTDQFEIRDRLTLTFPAIMASKKILVLLKGENKKAILDELEHGTKTMDEFPAKKLLEHPELTIHFCVT